MSSVRRLYRSQSNKVVAGICGGIGEYLDTDPTVIRLLWVVLTMLGGSGILLYVLGLFIIPKQQVLVTPVEEKKSNGNGTFSAIVGAALVFFGILFLLDNLHLFYIDELWDWSWKFVLPSILILAGIYLLSKKDKMAESVPASDQSTLEGTTASAPQSPKKLRRSLTDKRVFGICGGIAHYFDVDATIVRLLYALFTIMSFGTGVLLYFVLYFVLQEESPSTTQPSNIV